MPGRPKMELSEHPFWTWSLEVYARPGVEEILLDLQDRLGLDVNMVLFACWTGVDRRGSLFVSEWEALIAGTAEWRSEVIIPLRGIRRFLKRDEEGDDVRSLRGKVKQLELEAERIMQMKIARMTEPLREGRGRSGDAVELAQASLEAYLAAAQIVVSDKDRILLSSLARGCCT